MKIPKGGLPITTPFPISSHFEVAPPGGKVMAYMFPMDGDIDEGSVYIGELPPRGTSVVARIHTQDGLVSKTLLVEGNKISAPLGVSVKKMDRLEVIVEEGLRDVWVAFSWRPDVRDSIMKVLRQVKEIEDAGV